MTYTHNYLVDTLPHRISTFGDACRERGLPATDWMLTEFVSNIIGELTKAQQLDSDAKYAEARRALEVFAEDG